MAFIVLHDIQIVPMWNHFKFTVKIGHSKKQKFKIIIYYRLDCEKYIFETTELS